MEEIWKDIIIVMNGVVYDFTGMYQISNLGRVRSLNRIDSRGHKVKGRIMKCKPGKDGYKNVSLSKDGKDKKFQVHRLVATAFIPNPDNLPIVNHRDENPSNNCVSNLEWCDAKYNVNYGTRNERLSESKKGKYTGDKNPRARKVICLETKQIFGCAKDAEKWCNGDVYNCCQGRNKTAGGYHWQYYEDYLAQQENVESF